MRGLGEAILLASFLARLMVCNARNRGGETTVIAGIQFGLAAERSQLDRHGPNH